MHIQSGYSVLIHVIKIEHNYRWDELSAVIIIEQSNINMLNYVLSNCSKHVPLYYVLATKLSDKNY